jgi:hypothetical protein
MKILKADIPLIGVHSSRTSCTTREIIKIFARNARSATLGSAIEAIAASSIAAEASLSRRVRVGGGWTNVPAVPTVEIVAALTGRALRGSYPVARHARAVAELARRPNPHVANGRTQRQAVSACAVRQQIVQPRTREAGEARRPIASSARRIAVIATIIPSILILIGIA